MTMFGSQWLANAGATYEIEQSIRFNDNDSAYMHRTPSAAGNQKTNTISCWVKRTNLGLGNSLAMFSAAGGSYGLTWYIDSSETDFSRERLSLSDGAATLWQANDYKLRDPASWYHFVFAMDTTQGTQSNRMKVYINGALVTADTNALVENTDYPFFDNVVNRIGSWTPSGGAAGRYMEGYMAEIHLIDGAQKAASDFGEYNSTTGQWVPIEYAGAYGDQGAYLKGQDSSALGDDTSGNGNDFSSSGLAANDQMFDSPTNNQLTLNVIAPQQSASTALPTIPTYSDGNKKLASTASSHTASVTPLTIPIPTEGKWHIEVGIDVLGSDADAGLRFMLLPQSILQNGLNTITATGCYQVYASKSGTSQTALANVVQSSDITDIAVSDRFGINVDRTDPTSVTIVGTLQGSAWFTDSSQSFLDEPYVFAIYENGNTNRNITCTIYSAEEEFTETVSSGHVSLCSNNLPAPAIADPSAYFQTTLYEGDGSTQSIDQDGNSTFSPNFVWIKNRDAADAHALFDTVRGATEVLSSNSTAAEATNADTLTAFESDGFALGADVIVNTNAESYVAWQWNEGATPGLDIVGWTGNATARTIAHNLGVVPRMMLVKNRDQGDKWAVYHAANTAAPATDYLILNETDATADLSSVWNDTAPTSSVFTVGTASLVNATGEGFIAYIFAPVEGFSAFGSYVGNGNASGPMVNLGFQPAFLLFKSTADNKWIMKDTKRDTFNPSSLSLVSDQTVAELTGDQLLDINSNGFKLRTTGSATNSNGVTYVYAAFAENPFKYANAR
jgi:hypothetical protein